MTDIVERLRNLAKKESGMPYRYADLMEAAAEIERQAARIAELEAGLSEMAQSIDRSYEAFRTAELRALSAEAKLATAVKALKRYAIGYCGEDTARAALKEIGGDHD